MAETRTIHDPFLNEPATISTRLVDRLRGKYANGPTLENGEPEFGWRQFETPPIQHEAADEIEQLEADKRRIDWLEEQIVDNIWLDDGTMVDVAGNSVRKAIDRAMAAAVADQN